VCNQGDISGKEKKKDADQREQAQIVPSKPCDDNPEGKSEKKAQEGPESTVHRKSVHKNGVKKLENFTTNIN